MLINTNKLYEYGFLPKVGQWIRVTGRLSRSDNDHYDPSISWISQLEHIEPPKKKPKISKESVLNVMTPQWKSFSQITTEMDLTSALDKELLKTKIKKLLRDGEISKTSKRGKFYWRNPNA
ncbi:MAG: hypothetical protein ACFFAO_05085 [Candidatus Hermodarchaeota archaeon]